MGLGLVGGPGSGLTARRREAIPSQLRGKLDLPVKLGGQLVGRLIGWKLQAPKFRFAENGREEGH